MRAAVAGEEAELDLGLAEACFIAGDSEVTGEGEFATSA